jgi:hypothetical protein
MPPRQRYEQQDGPRRVPMPAMGFMNSVSYMSSVQLDVRSGTNPQPDRAEVVRIFGVDHPKAVRRNLVERMKAKLGYLQSKVAIK